MTFDEIILTDLVNIYEKRDSHNSSFKTKVKIVLNKDRYPKYFDNINEFDEAIKRLSLKGYIFTHKMKHDVVIDFIYLNLDYIDEIKELLGINSIAYKRDNLIKELNKYNDDIIVNLRNMIIDKINSNKSIVKYLNDDFIDSIRVIHYLENIQVPIYERNASNYLFNDSKRLNKLRYIIEDIYSNSNIFEEKGILSVTPYLYIKGEGIIRINQEIIDLKKLNTSIGIPIDNIDNISFLDINNVTTIENLTTFYDYIGKGCIIYLGGFPTKGQINILNKIKEVCNTFYHFGDIDYGGYLILDNLISNLNIDINTINMDLETLINNKRYLSHFNDDKYIEKLYSLLDKPNLVKYYDVIKYMIDNRVWLEQESFYNR